MPIHQLPSFEGDNFQAQGEKPTVWEPEPPKPVLYDAGGKPLATPRRPIGFRVEK